MRKPRNRGLWERSYSSTFGSVSEARPTNSHPMKTSPRILATTVAALLLTCHGAHATSFTWDGGGPGEDWSAGGNWATNVAPSFDGSADLVFSGIAGLSPYANLDWSIRSLTFPSGAAPFTIAGNTLTLGAGGITNADDSVQTILNSIVLGAAQTFTASSTGSMSILGNINTNGRILTIAPTTDFITLGGAISGSGGIVVNGNAGLVLTGDASNTYTGGTTINGAVTFAKTGGATAIPGALVIGNGSGPASVAIGFDEQIANFDAINVNEHATFGLGNGVTETIGALVVASGAVQIGGGTLSTGAVSMFGGSIASGSGGKLMLNGDITAVSSGLQSAIISGNVNLGGATRTITVIDGLATADLEIQATLSNGSLVKEGAGALLIRGPQNYGSLLAREGLVEMASALGTGAASVSVSPISGSATVNFQGNQRLAALTIGNGGIVTLGDGSNGTGDAPLSSDLEPALLPQAVPEPATGTLAFAAAAALLGVRRRKRETGRGERI